MDIDGSIFLIWLFFEVWMILVCVGFLVLMIILEDFHLCLISFSCHHECMLC